MSRPHELNKSEILPHSVVSVDLGELECPALPSGTVVMAMVVVIIAAVTIDFFVTVVIYILIRRSSRRCLYLKRATWSIQKK